MLWRRAWTEPQEAPRGPPEPRWGGAPESGSGAREASPASRSERAHEEPGQPDAAWGTDPGRAHAGRPPPVSGSWAPRGEVSRPGAELLPEDGLSEPFLADGPSVLPRGGEPPGQGRTGGPSVPYPRGLPRVAPREGEPQGPDRMDEPQGQGRTGESQGPDRRGVLSEPGRMGEPLGQGQTGEPRGPDRTGGPWGPRPGDVPWAGEQPGGRLVGGLPGEAGSGQLPGPAAHRRCASPLPAPPPGLRS